MYGKKGQEYPDIYFEPCYAALYDKEGSRAEEFRFESEAGLITNLFMKRKIDLPQLGGIPWETDEAGGDEPGISNWDEPDLLHWDGPDISPGDGNVYYDITTPYGYGGPVVHYASDRERLVRDYMEAFREYVSRENIVAEFIRFHPVIGNAADFRGAYDVLFDRKTVGTNLTFEDVIGTEFSPHRRRDIRRILRNPDISYFVDEHPETLDDFMDIYYSTMKRDGAEEYYYFREDYFRKMMATFPDNVITGKVMLGGKLIAMGVYFRYGDLLHAHLSGTFSEYLSYSPAYILKYALALYGHEKGYRLIHYGGGSSRAGDNGLYRFKKEFGRNTEFDFCIAKKVWNEEVYRKLCEASGSDIRSDFFPAYRSSR